MLFEPIIPGVPTSHDGLDQAYHCLIEGNQLIPRWQALPRDTIAHFIIAETGFGCGLNFLLAWMHFDAVAPSTAQLHFISAEKNPLIKHDLDRIVSLWPTLKMYADKLLAVYPELTPGSHLCLLDEGRVTLTLMFGDVVSSYESLLLCGDAQLEPKLRPWGVDVWFLNDFECSDDFRSMMDMLSCKESKLSKGIRRTKRYAPWFVDYPQRRDKRAIVLGAGLAGVFTAQALAKKGWQVDVLDMEKKPGLGASGNQQAVLFPNLSAYRSPITTFMLSAFLFATRFYRELLTQHPTLGELFGILQLAVDEKSAKYHATLGPWLEAYPALGRLVSEVQASDLAGIDIHARGLFVPQAGWIDSSRLCDVLAKTQGVVVHSSCEVTRLQFDGNAWDVEGHNAPVLIVAAGHRTAQFEQTSHLPLKTFRGQMTSFESSARGDLLKIPVCGKGHILPRQAGAHRFGATYQPGRFDVGADAMDDEVNYKQLEALPIEKIYTKKVQEHWAGIRAATPDYFPLVGPVADPVRFSQANHRARFNPEPGAYQPGLYVCAGFGSRGLTTIPLAATYLACLIDQTPHGLARAMAQSMSPARFLIKTLAG